MAEDKPGVKLLGVMYFGKRHLNLRTDKKVMTQMIWLESNCACPERMLGNFRESPGSQSDSNGFHQVYTGLQTGAIDGQDNPLPTDKDKKFYEVTKQIILTGHPLT